MYTLEDDQETSARLRKRDFANTPAVPGDQGKAGSGAQVPGKSSFAHRFSPEQSTSSFKKLTTPNQPVANKHDKRAALAALAIACTSVFFTALDQTVVVTALPKIIADPGINIPFTQIDHAAWIISAYLLGFIIAMPLMGRVSDIYGRRRILLLCLSIFGIGSIFCGLAPTLGQVADLSFLSNFGIDTSSPGLIWLISARFIQSIGGGAVVPVAMAIVSDFYGSVSSSIGSMPIGGSFTAKNIRITVQGSDIHILSDIYWSGVYIGTADSAISPSAAGGNLVLHVLSTTISIFGLFNFPMNSYNRQIEQTLNSKLGTAFAGKFYVDQAEIGPNSLLPCAASDSLVLTGNISALG